MMRTTASHVSSSMSRVRSRFAHDVIVVASLYTFIIRVYSYSNPIIVLPRVISRFKMTTS